MAQTDRYQIIVDTEKAQESVKGLAASTKAFGVALAAIATGVVVTSIVDITARFEDLRTTLTTVAGDAQKGAEAFKSIQTLATKTQFGVEELTGAYIKLAGAGIQPTERLFRVFTDAAAVSTDQLGSLQAITDLFSRTVSGGLGLEDLNRLADRGIPVFAMLEEKLGLTRLQLTEFGKTAEGARAITTALAESIEERFGGATAARLENLSTKMSNFTIALKNAADQVGQGMGPALGMMLDSLTGAIGKSNNFTKVIGEGMGRAIVVTTAAVEYFAGKISYLADVVIDIVTAPFKYLAQALDWIANKLGYTGSAVDDFASMIADAFDYVGVKASEWDFTKHVNKRLDEYEARLKAAAEKGDVLTKSLDDIAIAGAKDSLAVPTAQAKELAIQANAAADAAKKAQKAMEAAAKKNAEAIKKATESATGFIRDLTEETADAQFELQALNMNTLERQVAEIERDIRTRLKRQVEELKKAMTPENSAQIQAQIDRITTASEQAINTQKQLAEQSYEHQRSFAYGWSQAFEEYRESATNAADQARNVFQSFTKGAEDAFVEFARTGKLSFKSLLQDLAEQLLRSQFRQLMANIGGSLLGGSGGGGLGGFLGDIFRANGGPVTANNPYIVGERGPELFVPNSSGTIVPNGQFGGASTVQYFINAVDAPSFQALVARDPGFIHQVAMMGAKSF